MEMTVEVSILENFGGNEVQLKRRWMEMWERLGARILKMPEWMQTIILEDVNTAISNKVAIMEMIQNATKSKKAL
jgi:hypothetical protein